MAKQQGARQQKRLAKQKAKRSEKRAALMRRDSRDPAIRLQGAARWPVVHALVGAKLWEDGVGSLVIARQEAAGRLVAGVYLLDVYCLGVKDAFWRAGTPGDFQALLRRIEEFQTMCPIAPECLMKIIQGAVAYARSLGFSPHPDFRSAAKLLEGIDPAACPHEFTFGRDGKPFYIQGPNESTFQARTIAARMQDVGGHYIVGVPIGPSEDVGPEDLELIEEEPDSLEGPF